MVTLTIKTKSKVANILWQLMLALSSGTLVLRIQQSTYTLYHGKNKNKR